MKWLPFWVKFSADSISKYFSEFSQKTGTDTSCKLSPNNLHEMSNLVFLEIYAELAKRVVKVKLFKKKKVRIYDDT